MWVSERGGTRAEGVFEAERMRERAIDDLAVCVRCGDCCNPGHFAR